MKRIETVTINRNGGPLRINAADYDAERDGPLMAEAGPEAVMSGTNQPGTSIGAVSGPTQPQDGASPATSPEAVSDGPKPAAVVKKGRKFFVSDAQGNPVVSEGIDAAGYANEADAWSAIMGANG